MAELEYWQKQGKEPLFPAVDTWQPEQRRLAGKLLIVGGNKSAFFAVANAMEMAKRRGVGGVRVLIPASLRGVVPASSEISYAEAEASGAFARAALPELMAQSQWADAVVLIGDFSKNAEVSMLLADFLKACDKPVYLTRDAIDAATPDVGSWSMREAPTTIFATVPQLQKTLRTMYYPKMISLTMPMNQLVETLHKFTLSFAMTAACYHEGQLLVAQDGAVVTENISNTKWSQITVWDGRLVIDAAILKLWNPNVPEIQSFATAMTLE